MNGKIKAGTQSVSIELSILIKQKFAFSNENEEKCLRIAIVSLLLSSILFHVVFEIIMK